jgi:hypothetical protein
MIQLQTRALDQRDRELGIKEKELQVKASDLADKHQLAEDQLHVDAADKADKLDLAREKLVQAGELGEQQIEVKALQVGMMGRAQDQELLAQDRADAQADVDRLHAEHESDQIGLSKDPEPSDEATEAAGPAPQVPEPEPQPAVPEAQPEAEPGAAPPTPPEGTPPQ